MSDSICTLQQLVTNNSF